MDLTTLFKGKKTYFAAAALAVVAWVRYQSGDLVGAGESIGLALGLFGLRCAVQPAPAPAPAPQPPQPQQPTQPQPPAV